ncbi:glutamate decarboxylase [Streptomyces roseirectus]|uniref:glutamate decarboxylase n=1 Tax=Streptomyces roseirectus TaxID=2768066 RepID=A0A7H0IPJ4_9ACTN|nr:pyridoxal-dependent decarboxylase [Streptomyces roseirectus]QNP74710.1 glutamate decarboxylase [Streptomyces roseirectus]
MPERNLGTYGTTFFEPKLKRISEAAAEYNLVNRAEYPGLVAIEQDCLAALGNLWHADGRPPFGCSTSGSTEAALLAGLALLRRRQRRGAPRTGSRPNLVVGAGAHVCWYRFCAYWGVEARTAPRDAGLTSEPAAFADACDEDTVGVITTLGAPEHGRYDPVEGVVAALDELESRRGLDVPVHVDAASGGFVAPFLQPDLRWDFRLPRVRSVNASGHKYGGTSLSVGWLLWRDAGDCPDDLFLGVDYIGDGEPAIGLSFSRAAAPVVQQHYLLTSPDAPGYGTALEGCRALARDLTAVLSGVPGLRLANPGLDLPVVSFTDASPGCDRVRPLAAALRARGWYVPVYALHGGPAGGLAGRIVVRTGMSGALSDRLREDVLAAVRLTSRRHG